MKKKNIFTEVSKVIDKLNKSGHTPFKILVTDEDGNIVVSSTTSEKLQYLDNVEEDIDAHIKKKLNKDGFTPDRILVVDDTGAISLSEIGRDKLTYLTNVDKDIQEQINDIKNSLGATGSEVDSVIEAIVEISQNITELAGVVSDIGSKADTNEQAIANLNEVVSKNTENINDLQLEVQSEKEKLTTFKEEVGNNFELVNSEIARNSELISTNISGVANNKNEIELLKALVGAGGDEEGSPSAGIIDLLNPFLYIVDNTKEGAYTDVAIQEAINKARLAGGGVVFIPFGEYLLENEILLYSNIKIVGTKGTILKRRNSSIRVFMRAGLKETDGAYDGLVNFEIHNITFDGEEKTEITGMLYLGHGNRIRVKNCVFKNLLNNWHMIEINGCKDVVIEDNIFENYRGTESIQIDFMLNDEVYPFPCLKDDTICDGITIKNNRFIKIEGTCIGNHSFKQGVMPRNIVIESNYFEDISEYCVHLSDIEKFVVKDNKIFNAQYGVSIRLIYTPSKQISIVDNYMDLQNRADSTGEQGRGITISPSAMDGIMDVVIRNNNIKNAVRYGIAVTASNVTIDGNTVEGSGLSGIWVHGGTCSTIINNFAKGNNTRGDSAHFDLTLGGNSNAQHRYSNLTNNHAWTFGIKSNTFPVTIMQNNFMNVPTVASGINTPLAYNNFIDETFKTEGLVK